MKIKRFVAKDMRTALLEIKEELGPDAVIMSNKKTADGVELMAAVDYLQSAESNNEQATPQRSREVTSNRSSQELDELSSDVVSLSSASKVTASSQPPADSLAALLKRQAQQDKPQERKSNESDLERQLKSFTDRLERNAQHDTAINSQTAEILTKAPEEHRAAAANNANTVKNDDLEQMRQEMHSIRQLLEHQVSGLMWQDMAQKDPLKAVLVNRLMSIGITEQFAEQVARFIPHSVNEDQAWQHAKKLLTQQLNTTSNDIIHRGGVVALVGPTGVGKTTTIAKLAARFAQIHGSDNVVMISTDSYRIGGFEQLSTYGKIIGCQVKMAKDSNALDGLLHEFSNKKLVLIDTAGMGQRDMRLAEHLATLVGNSRVNIRNYLVLAANAQQRVMQENVQRFKKIPLAGCIFTKLDESLSVGEIIDTAIQNNLPIGYLTDGQRVPEDIKVANAEKLVTLAERMAEKYHSRHISRPMSMTSAAIV
ncbi:flagellar biosynthesis protein FlhF [Thalassotalea ganghwensis]